jgi:hypothetical protein
MVFFFFFRIMSCFFILNDIHYLPVVGMYVCMYAFMWFLYTLHLLVLVLYFFLSYIYYIYLFYLFIYFSLLVVETVCYHGRPGWYLVAGTTMTNSNNSWQYIYIYIYIIFKNMNTKHYKIASPCRLCRLRRRTFIIPNQTFVSLCHRFSRSKALVFVVVT